MALNTSKGHGCVSRHQICCYFYLFHCCNATVFEVQFMQCNYCITGWSFIWSTFRWFFRLSVSNIWFFYVRTHPVGLSTTPWVAFPPTFGPWGTSELDPGDPAEPNTEAFLWPDHQLMKFVLFQMYWMYWICWLSFFRWYGREAWTYFNLCRLCHNNM